MKKIAFPKAIPITLLIVVLSCFNACTTMHFKAIAPPPPAGKLRVAVLTITGNGGPSGWGLPHKEWSRVVVNMVGEYLQDTGIYNVVSTEDVDYAVGSQTLSADEYWWLKNDKALIKQYGKALYADYAMIISRQASDFDARRTYHYKYDIKFINVGTGRLYSAFDHLKHIRGNTGKNIEIVTKEIFPSLYKKIFYEAKGDLLATAMSKGRLMPAEETKKHATPEKEMAAAPPSLPKATSKISPATPDLSSADKRNKFEKRLENDLQNKTPVTDKTKLVVYDFNANEQLQVASLVLSEALREELFRLGNFLLVNRENIVQVMSELRLQQSGLVDEKQVVRLGKWLAANEAVTGMFTQFGNSYILQAKRTDITKMSTLGFGSLKCKAGQEEELLASLPDLARKIAGLEK